MKVLLTRLSSNHQNLRTDQVEGEASAVPAVGSPFTMTAPPLEAGNMRVVYTTPIKSLEMTGDSTYIFWTENSKYRVDVLTDNVLLRES